MNDNANVFIFLNAFAFLVLSAMFYLLFKSNKGFEVSSDSSEKDD
tara:strand:+ start:267 stop:401 length:135 start_codon:yes stop_codon:yes gene_type:complete